MTPLRAFLRDTHGSAAVEQALILPLLLILTFVGFEAGHYFYTEQKIIKAVREGARYGGRLSFTNFQCGQPTNATAVSQIQNVTRTGTTTGTKARVVGLELGDITVTHRCDANFANSGIFKGTTGGAPIVLVYARTNYNSIFEALGLMDSTAIVQASSEAVVNGI